MEVSETHEEIKERINREFLFVNQLHIWPLHMFINSAIAKITSTEEAFVQSTYEPFPDAETRQEIAELTE